MGSTVIGIVWIIWMVGLLVLYHKVFQVYYFDLGYGLMKEFLTAFFLAILMTGITFALWWLTAIVIIIGGLALKKKVSSNAPLIAAVVLAIIVAIVGISYKAEKNSDNTTARVERNVIVNELQNEL